MRKMPVLRRISQILSEYSFLRDMAEYPEFRIFRASALLESGEDLQTMQEELSSLKLPESLRRNGLHIYFWKTSPVCYRMTAAGHLKLSSPSLLNWGIISNGVCITAHFLESPNSEDACTLSQVLMDDVPEKYFLSQAAMEKILKNSSRVRKVDESTT